MELLHEGEPLRLGGSAAGSEDGSACAEAEAPLDLDALMNSDEDIERQLDAAMARVSGVLIRHRQPGGWAGGVELAF